MDSNSGLRFFFLSIKIKSSRFFLRVEESVFLLGLSNLIIGTFL
jgi:hypothetical protein